MTVRSRIPYEKLSEQAKIGHRIRTARDSRFILQNALAEEVGISQTLISRIEGGLETLTINNLVKICKVLGVSADEILGLKE